MNMLTEIVPSIYRLTIPFEDIYTTVFILRTPLGTILLDTATYPSDVDDYLLPALTQLGVTQKSLKYIVLSHSHQDHAGGLERLMSFFPSASIVSLSENLHAKYARYSLLWPDEHTLLLDTIRILPIPGHSPDCVALFDLRSRTLLTGDSLQLFGIYGSGKWGANISRPDEHLAAVERLRSMDIQTIIASHDYHPCGYIARGSNEINHCLNQCREALDSIRRFILDSPSTDDQTLSNLYNQSSGLPTVGSHVFSAVRASKFP